ncbi:3-ketosteroid-delta-1-dehydrogenase [Gordonia sp. LSe1-13]|uniref:3-ketosteroid-delta-1-dehydrogenase n=1 Tax=Gordonia sesuvii TaxID=3116777 RepID=A0ABU7MA36_9ACTN|nr:3-ketosteroid-delta-1-dehydrogenase [Gordonia sp. LSe1-13]
MALNKLPPKTTARDCTVDLLVVGSGTGMASALAAHEQGLSALIIEKSEYVGGSTALSGGAFWIPGNPALDEASDSDALTRARRYLRAVVGDDAPPELSDAFLRNGIATVEMLLRTTPMKFVWAKGYSDYHPTEPGGRDEGRTCECKPYNARRLGKERARLRSGSMKAPIPMPVTGADYKWMNLMLKKPLKAVPRIALRLIQGIGGMAIGREYISAGQALVAGMYTGVLEAGIPTWTETRLVRLVTTDGKVTGAVVSQDGTEHTVTTRRGVVLAAGGFDHEMELRRKYQSERLGQNISLGADTNTGDAIVVGQDAGAAIALMDQAWWYPAVSPLPDAEPLHLLAERSLPGSFIVDQTGRRFINESVDYMTFGQRWLERDRAGDPVEEMWLVFDQEYRDSYTLTGQVFPRQPLPDSWYENGIAYTAATPEELARKAGLPEAAFKEQFERFNTQVIAGRDGDFGRGENAYDNYYGDPTNRPNPNLRALQPGSLYAVRMTLSDLGTCGGLQTDANARVLREDGAAIEGLYAVGNTSANAFGKTYPGAGGTIGQGLVFGYVAAHHAASLAPITA